MFIDTPPHGERAPRAACAIADLIVIPCRPSAFDILAIDTTVDIAARIEVPAVIVLNQARQRGTMTDDARAALKEYGVPICPTGIVSRASIAESGRQSMSSVVRGLIDSHRDELKREAGELK